MNNLTFCLKNGIELFLGRKGLFITLNGYIKLSGKPKQTISERTTRALLAKKIIAAPTLKIPGRSIRNGKLIPFDLALEWLAKDNPDLAEAMGAAGATIYMHQLAGFKITSDAIAKPELPPIDIRVVNYIAALEKTGYDFTNPQNRQTLQQWLNAIHQFS